MPSCQWRDKPGLDPMCKTMPNPGEEMCPRHKLLDQARQSQQQEREREKLLKREVVRRNPETRRGMLEQGYQFIGNDVCVCGNALEWWRTPNQREAPYEPMKELESPSVSHYRYCKRAFDKRYTKRYA